MDCITRSSMHSTIRWLSNTIDSHYEVNIPRRPVKEGCQQLCSHQEKGQSPHLKKGYACPPPQGVQKGESPAWQY